MYKSEILTDLQVHLAVGDKCARSFMQWVDREYPDIIDNYFHVAVEVLDSLFSVWKVAPDHLCANDIQDAFYNQGLPFGVLRG